MKANFQCVSFLSDFGLKDETVSVCKGLLLRNGVDVPVLDISHEIEPFNIISGGWILRGALPFIPKGVHLAVVDPGVGTLRKIVILETFRGDFLVGPDNGLLIPASTELGGVRNCWSCPEMQLHQPHISKTFHARDIMVPVVASLFTIEDPTEKYQSVCFEELIPFPVSPSLQKGGVNYGTVVHIDQFGSIRTNIPWNAEWKGRAQFSEDLFGGRTLPIGQTFADVPSGCPLVLEDSWGFLSIAVHRGRAVDVFPVNIGRSVSVKIMITQSTVKG